MRPGPAGRALASWSSPRAVRVRAGVVEVVEEVGVAAWFASLGAMSLGLAVMLAAAAAGARWPERFDAVAVRELVEALLYPSMLAALVVLSLRAMWGGWVPDVVAARRRRVAAVADAAPVVAP